nr:RNA-directed DNA polymerase, eukaryota, reverse transcriptase zinc-binding domain protein [Tanacetum cinerariifolium]
MRIGVNKEEVDSTAANVGCSTFSPLFKYLGVQVGANISWLSSWHEVKAKIPSILSRWKLKTVSIGYRLTLLKSVLSSIPLYYMSLFKDPSGTVNALEAIQRNFINGMERLERKIAWISWDKILVSKKYGGSSLWSRFIKAVHGVKGSIDNHVSTNRNSIWLNIVRDIYSLIRKRIDLLSFVRKKVGDGESSLFWDDTWLGEATLKMQYLRLYALELYKDISVADKMRHPNLYVSFRHQPKGGAEQEQFRDLSSRITDVILPQIKDRLVWSLDGSDEFSVKSVQNFIDDSILPKCDALTRWVKLVPIKLNILAWRIRLDRLPTQMNLSSRGLEIPSSLCPLCIAMSTTALSDLDGTSYKCNIKILQVPFPSDLKAPIDADSGLFAVGATFWCLHIQRGSRCAGNSTIDTRTNIP